MNSKKVLELQVARCMADRRVPLLQIFNSILVEHGDRKQYLLLMVENRRQRFPNLI